MTLYRLHTGGTLARHEPDGLKLYEIGHPIELDPDEAKRLNEGRSLANSRVVLVGGETETTTRKAKRESPEVAHIEVGEPGVPSVDELIAMGADPTIVEVAIRAQKAAAEQAESAKPLPLPNPCLGDLPIKGENLLPAVEPAESESEPALAAATDDEVAPDWATYLAGVSPAEVAEVIRGLESTGDVQAAIDAENGPGGKRRPLVIRAGNAALRKLRAS